MPVQQTVAMSDAFPPIPPSGSTPPPPPPPFGGTPTLPSPPSAPPFSPGFGGMPPAPPSYGGIPTAPPLHPPAGYQAYQAGYGAPSVPTAGLRKATIVLFSCASACAVGLGLVAYQRGGTVDDFFNGAGTIKAVDDADGRVGGLAILLVLLQIAGAVLLAVWSNRTVSNAKARGANASSGLAAGGWFIPIGNYWVPWGQLRKAAATFGPAPGSLTRWQALFIGQAALSIAARSFGNFDINTSTKDAVSNLHNQGFLFLGTGVLLAVATIVAAKAMRDVDALTSPV